jgi:hypothetical protein
MTNRRGRRSVPGRPKRRDGKGGAGRRSQALKCCVLGAALTIVWTTNGESQAQPALEGDQAFIAQRMLKQMGVVLTRSEVQRLLSLSAHELRDELTRDGYAVPERLRSAPDAARPIEILTTSDLVEIAASAPFDGSDVQAWGDLAKYAQHTIRRQPQIVALQDLARGNPDFAGLWLDSDGTVVVAFTTGEVPTSLRSDDLINYLGARVVRQQHSLVDLDQAMSEVISTLEALKVKADVELDQSENTVVVHLGTDDFARLQQRLPEEVRDNSLVTRATDATRSEPTTTLRGGRVSDSCTSGFALTNGNGNRAMLRAGHCGGGTGNTTFAQDGVTMSALTQTVYGDLDREYGLIPAGHTNDQYLTIYQSYPNDTRLINGSFQNSSFYEGMPVQKQGRITGYTYGTVDNLCAHPGWIPTGSGSTCFLRTGHGIRSISGDSGGPSFQTNTAVGTTTGCVTNDPNGCGGPYNPAYFYDAHVARIQSQLSNSIGYYLYTGSGK